LSSYLFEMTTEDFKTALLPLKNKLFRFALHLLSNRQEAEDVVQDVYLKLWEMRDELFRYNSTEALMMTIIRNKSLDKLKSKKNKTLSLNTNINVLSGGDPLEQSGQKDMVSQVKKIINRLPEQQKTVILLRDIEGMELNEIAEITGFQMNYIRVNLSRARKKVRESFQRIEAYEIG